MISYVDGCPEDTTGIDYPGEGTLFANWPESNIGQHIMPCPCGNIDVDLNIERECVGNFVTQAVWNSPNDQSCLDLNYELCIIASVRKIGSKLYIAVTGILPQTQSSSAFPPANIEIAGRYKRVARLL